MRYTVTLDYAAAYGRVRGTQREVNADSHIHALQIVMDEFDGEIVIRNVIVRRVFENDAQENIPSTDEAQ